jgi:hypothetical protein
MNGIIYRITIICTLFIMFGCKNESIKKELKSNLLSINDIKSIKLQDTLWIDYEGDDLGEDIDFGKNESQYKSLLFDKIALDRESFERFKKFEYNDVKTFEWIRIKKRINLHPNYNTVILSTLESVYTLLNYNSKGELIDFLDLSKYHQQICQCTSTVYIDKNGIVHCQIGAGKPFYPYVEYKVNDEGKFEIINQYTPPNEEKMSGPERLDYIIKKTATLNDEVNLNLYLQSDEFDSSNTTFIAEKDVKNVLFSKNQSANIYESFSNSINEYTDVNKDLNILGKIINADKILLICNISGADQFCVIFLLNKTYEITDFKIFSINGIHTDVNIQDLIAKN